MTAQNDCSNCSSSNRQYQIEDSISFDPTYNSLTVYQPGGATSVCVIGQSSFPIAIVPRTDTSDTTFNICLNSSPDPNLSPDKLELDLIKCFQSDDTVVGSANAVGLGIVGTVDLRQGKALDDCSDAAKYYYYQVKNGGSNNRTDTLWLDVDASNLSVYYKSSDQGRTYCETYCYCDCMTGAEIQSACEDPSAQSCVNGESCASCSQMGGKLDALDYLSMAGEPTYHPLSNYQGEIEEVLLADILSTENTVENVLQRYQGMFDAFDKQVQFDVLIDYDPNYMSRAAFKMFQARVREVFAKGIHPPRVLTTFNYCDIMDLGRDLLTDPDFECNPTQENMPYSWAQDPVFVATDASGSNILLSPNQASNFTTFFFGREVSLGTSMLEKTIPLIFQGGNLLNDDSTLYVGADDLLSATQSVFGKVDGETLPYMRSFYQKCFGARQVVWVGDTTFSSVIDDTPNFPGGQYQPVYHLDMFMTLGGIIEENGEEKELIFVGEQQLVTDLSPNVLAQAPVIGRMGQALDQAATQLQATRIKGRRTKIVRVPLPLYVLQAVDSGLEGEYLSYNNCQMEITESGKTIYLPAYPAKPLSGYDEAAAEVFRANGFKVVWVQGHFVQSSIEAQYSLNCLTKILRRKR